MAKTTEELAREYAENQISNTRNETQNLLDQYEKIAQNQRNALDINKQISENRINAQKDDVLENYQNNARQAYINYMLGKPQLAQQLSEAGLNTSGILGSAYAKLENSYGNNLASLQNQRDKSINDINRQLNEAQLQYSAQENQLLANIEQARLDLQKYGNELAYQRYQDALNNYLTFANYDNQKKNSGSGGSGGNNPIEFTNGLSDKAMELYNQYATALKASANSGTAGSGIYNTLNNTNTALNLISSQYNAGNINANDVKILTQMLGV